MPAMPRDIDGDSSDDEPMPELEFKDAGLNRIIIVDNLPVVTEEKYAKLVNVVTKIFSRIGNMAENGLHMPRDGSNTTKGYAFIEFTTKQEAQAAVEQTNGYKLDKSHVFKVTLFSEFDRIMSTPEQYAPMADGEFSEIEDLKEWMQDSRARDQFVVRQNMSTEIYWNDVPKPDQAYAREKWSDFYVAWSPLGSFLATFHRQGIAIWGGKSWAKIMRYNHANVQLIDFSPDERFVVTWSALDPQKPDIENLVVWEARSGSKLRGFVHDPRDEHGAPVAIHWPVFKWNNASTYLAKGGTKPGELDSILIYETPSMKLLGKKSLKVPGMSEFCWSPKDDVISVVVPEADNNPARVVLYDIPSRNERRQKNLFSVADIRMVWQNDGDYLCVKADRLTKTKKIAGTNFEFFRLRQKDVPVETFEYKQPIVNFAWEPHGHRFAVIHGEGQRLDVSFHTMRNKETGVEKLMLVKTLEKRQVNNIFWSPQGNFLVLAGFKNFNGVLEFWNANEMEIMGQEEHFMTSDVEWDPTGRYVASYVTNYQLENGFNIWSFQGKILHTHRDAKFYQFLWRPRPQSLLSKAKEKEVRKNLAEYSKRYQKEDDAYLLSHQTGALRERKEQREAWAALMRQRTGEREEQKAQRKALRDDQDSDDEGDMIEVEETVEECVDIVEEIVK